MHGVKPSENKVNNQEQTRNQGLHFSVGDNTISYLIPKKDGDQFVNKSDKISYSDEVYEGNNYYKVTLNTNNYDLWIDEEGLSSRILKMLIIRLPSNTRSIMLVYLEKLKSGRRTVG